MLNSACNRELRDGIRYNTNPVSAVNEQIKGLFAPLIRQLEKLTRLVQGLVTTPHPRHYPKFNSITTYGTTAIQSDMVKRATLTQNTRQPMTNLDTDDETTCSEYGRQF